jgi:NOL1/NOP2/fmu family ribosome biogenesis protein
LPDESLALSWIINKRAFETADLEWKDAIAFLKKDNILLPDSGKGWVMVQFEGVPLGFAKNLGNRVNNAYPQEWRIRMEVDASKYAPFFSFEK